jgi:hypothetical protein
MKKKHIGSTFEDFLKEEGIYDEATEYAQKRIIALNNAVVLKTKRISKSKTNRPD